MPIMTKSPSGTVTGLWGSAFVRLPSGKLKPLSVGDKVKQGEHIVTTQDGIVQITPNEGSKVVEVKPTTAVLAKQAQNGNGNDVDQTIASIENDDANAATAAGLTGGADGGMQEGLRVDRVSESVGQQNFDFGTFERAEIEPIGPGGVQLFTAVPVPPTPNSAPVVNNDSVVVAEDTPLKFDPRANDTDADGDPLTIVTVAGQPIGINTPVVITGKGTVTLNPDGTLTFTPAANFNGPLDVPYTVSDGKGGTGTGNIHVDVTPVNDPPVITDNPTDPSHPGQTFDPTTGSYSVTTAEDTPVSGQVRATDIDGDALTYGKGTDPTHGTVTVGTDGKWTYTPANNYNGPDSFTVLVDDGHGGKATSTINIGVTPVNDPPVITDEPTDPNNPGQTYDPATGNYTVTTEEDTPVSGQVKAIDADGDPLTYSLIPASAPLHGTVVVKPDGTWTYTPSTDYNGSDSFQVVVSDGHGGTATSTVNIGVTPVNDAPVALADEGHVVGGATLDVSAANGVIQGRADPDDSTLPPEGKDSDPDGDPLVVTHVAAADGVLVDVGQGVKGLYGTLTLQADGSYKYEPDPNAYATIPEGEGAEDLFTYTISDGQGGESTTTLSIRLLGDNHAPVALADEVELSSGSLDVDAANGVIQGRPSASDPSVREGVDSDADDDALAVTKVGVAGDASVDAGQPVKGLYGTLTLLADGSYKYVPNPGVLEAMSPGEGAEDLFSYTISDGKGHESTTTLSIRLIGENDPPVIDDPNAEPATGNYNVTTLEDTPVSGQVKATDPDGDELTYTKGTDPTHGTVTVGTDGKWTYTPAKDYNGPDSFTVLVEDGQGGKVTSTIKIGVTGVNDPPVVTDPNADPATGNYNVTTEEDKPVSGQVKATDADGDTLTYSKSSDPLHGTVTVGTDGKWTYTPAKDYNGTDSFTVLVDDGHGGKTTSTVNIGVTPVNDPPVVTDPNADPVTGNYNVNTPEDTPVSGQVKATDVDTGDVLTYAKGTDPLHGTVTVGADGKWTYTPAKDYNGPDSFTVLVDDGHGGKVTSTINIGVTPVNDPPVITDPNADPVTGNYSASTPEDTPVSGQVKATDVDTGDVLTYAKGTDPLHGTVTVGADGKWTYTPAKDYNGPDSFKVLVDDGHGGKVTSTINIGVTPVNDPPIAVDDSVKTDEDQAKIINVLGNDKDVDAGDKLTVVAINGQLFDATHPATIAGKGVVSLNTDGTLTFTPVKDFNGPVEFSYTIADTAGATSTAKVLVDVGAVSDTPVAANDAAVTDEDTPVKIDVLKNDSDADVSDQLTVIEINGQPIDASHPVTIAGIGVVSLNGDKTLQFTPAQDYNGDFKFNYTVTDGQTPVKAEVSVKVNPVNDAPVAVNDNVNTEEEKAVEVQVRLNDKDVDVGDTLTVSGVTQGSHGTVVVNPTTGNPVYTPETDFVGTDTFTYTIKDSAGATSTATVTVTVGGVNDAPVAREDEGTVDQDGTLNVSALNGVIQSDAESSGRDTDEDGDTLSVVAVGFTSETSQHTNGTVGQPLAGKYGVLVLLADGSYTYTPNAAAKTLGQGEGGSDLFNYTVTDGGLTSSTTLQIFVTGSNDGPVAVADSGTTPEDTNFSLNVLTNDTDIDGDSLSLTAINGQPASVGSVFSIKDAAGNEIAKVTVKADGLLEVDPAANYNGQVNFNYTVSDGTATSVGQVNVLVDSRNDPPVAKDDPVSSEEDKVFTFDPRANDTDPENDSLTITHVNGQAIDATHPVTIAGKGTISLNGDGTLTFTPVANFNGKLDVPYTVNDRPDGKGESANAVIHLDIKEVNDPPVITDPNADPATGNYTVTTPEDTPVSGQVKASDADGDALTYSKSSDPLHGTVTVGTDGKWTYTPAKDYNGTDSFKVLVDDGHGGKVTSTINIGVTPVNDPPVITDPNADPATGNYTVSTAEDTPVSGQVKATDVDGDPLTYTKSSDPLHGTVTVGTDGKWTYTPAKDYNGPDSFKVLVDDGHGGKVTSTINIGVTPVNDPPIAVDDSVKTDEDQAKIINVLGNDKDVDAGDKLTVVAINGQLFDATHPATIAGKGVVSLNTDGTLTFTPVKDFNGPVEFSYTIADTAGATSTAKVLVDVGAVSDTPVAANDAAVTDEDTPVKIDVLTNDSDADLGDKLSVIEINGQAIDATHPVTIAGKGVVSLNNDGTLQFAPAQDYNGEFKFNYTVTDGQTPVKAEVSVKVNPVNDAPVAVDDNVNTLERVPVEVLVRLNDTDVDGDKLTVSAITQGAHGVVAINPLTGNPIYTSVGNYAGPDSFTYTVKDPSGATSTATVHVTVGGVNDAPEAHADTATLGQNALLDVSALNGVIQSAAAPAGKDTDPENDTLSVSAVNFGAKVGTVGQALAGTFGTLTLNLDGSYKYVPNDAAKHLDDGQTGQDVFGYTVRDPGGLFSTTTLTITVTGSNDAPVAVADSGTTPEDTNFSLNVLANDTDIDGDKLTLTQINGQPASVGSVFSIKDAAGNEIAKVTVKADGLLEVDPAANYNGQVNFNYTVSDGTATSVGQVNVLVDSRNDPPVAKDDPVTNNEDTVFTFDPRANDTDPENDSLTITHVNGQAIDATHPVTIAGKGTISLNGDGTLTFTPVANFNGKLDVPYTVNDRPDGKGESANAVIHLDIKEVNDPPVITDPNADPATGNYTVTTPEDTPVSGQVKASDADGDALTYSKSTDPLHGTVTVNANGTWTYTPAKDYNGTDSFKVLVDDGHGGKVTSTINIGVTPVNDPPVITDPNADPATGNYTVTTPEDTPVSGQVKASDADGDALTYSKSSDPLHGTVTVGTDGKWTYTPAKDYNGTDSFKVLVDDGHGGKVTSTINIGVTPVNDPPVITDPNADPATGNYTVTTPEDTPVSGQVKASDADGDALTYSKSTDPLHGTVTVNANGTWTYTPAKDYNGADSFKVLVDDGHGGKVTSTINIGVTPVNDPPVITDPNADPATGNYTVTTPEDTPVSGQVKASDADGDALTYSKSSDPLHGTVTVGTDGKWTYTPAKDYNGTDSFKVLVDDGHGGKVTSTINIGVTPVNDPPVITDPNADPATGNYTVTTPEDTPVNGQVKATDADGDTLTYEAGEQPLHGTVTVGTDGKWTYTPGKDYNGSDSFTVVVDDGHGGTTTSIINVGITPVADAPVVGNQAGSVSEEGLTGGLVDNIGSPADTTNATSVSGKIVATDADGALPNSWTLDAPTTPITSHGATVVWTGQGTQTLTGTANGVTVATLKIDNSGQYTFDLKTSIDHPVANAEDVLPINFTVTAKGADGLSGTSTLTINVEDDSPSAAVSQSVATSVTDSNVMVILDLSSSMRLLDGVNGTSRFASAISSIKTLLDKYDDIGDTRIRIVTFGTGAQALGTEWTTVAAAKALLDGLPVPTQNTQGTNYDAALANAMTAFTASGKLTTGVNVSYFISDGLPSYGNGSTSALTGTLNGDGNDANAPGGDEGIQAAEETLWKNFLTSNDINSFSLGVGSGVTTAQTALDPIAYNGHTNANTNAVLVTSFASLDGVLGATVPAPISGNLLTGSLLPSGGAGADGPAFVKSITIDGVTYTYNAANGGSITTTGGTSKGVFDTTTDTLTVTTKEGGHYVVTMPTGDYHYTVPASVTVRNISEVMGFTVSDSDGDTTSAALTVNVTNTGAPTPNDPPVVTAQSASVSEEGLAGGITDTTGTPDTTNSAVATGKMIATDPDGNAITGWTLDAPTTAITSNGVAVTWTGNGTNTLVGKAGTLEVGKLVIDANGNYTFTLEAPLDHPGKGVEDVLGLNFKVSASDGRALGSNTLTINVEDDSPSAAVPVVASATVLDTNLMVVLDVSGSMAGTDGGTGPSRLSSAISSINTLLDKYDALGDVRVRIVTFSTNAAAEGDVWTTVAQARTLLSAIGNKTPTGGTNYDEALGDAITAFNSAGKLASGQNVSYFISDGEPTYGSGTTSELTPAGSSPGTPATNGTGNSQTGSDTGIQAAEETLWKNFLIANDVDSFALGVGAGVSAASRTYLDPIAYDGRSEQDRNGLIVTAFSQLDNALANTIPTPVSGNLLSGSFTAGGVGADGHAIIKSLTVDGITYTYDPANDGSIVVTGGTSAGVFDTTTDTLTITTKQADGSVGGKFIVDMDGGDYRYEVPPAVTGSSLSQSLNFVVSDGDGDTTGSTLTINVSKPAFLNGDAGANALNGGAGVDIISGGDGGDTITGNAGDDKLFGNNGDDVINGGAGNDLLSGGAGNDVLNGGDGNDIIIGGHGNDIMTGGAGSDVFAWTLADPAVTSAARSIDTIKDFNPAAATAGGDVLDLRDLLTGENTTGGSGNLQNFLDFNTVTANGVSTTTIRVSPTGGFANGTYSASADTHEIVLEGVDIRAGLGLAAGATDNQIIAKMITDGKLLVDNT